MSGGPSGSRTLASSTPRRSPPLKTLPNDRSAAIAEAARRLTSFSRLARDARSRRTPVEPSRERHPGMPKFDELNNPAPPIEMMKQWPTPWSRSPINRCSIHPICGLPTVHRGLTGALRTTTRSMRRTPAEGAGSVRRLLARPGRDERYIGRSTHRRSEAGPAVRHNVSATLSGKT
jgi:hypothetical protein